MITKINIIFFFILISSVSNAQIIFNKAIGGTGDDKANCVKQTLDHGYIIVGSTNSFGAGGLDVYAIKTDKNGDTMWTRTYGGIYDDVGNAVIQNPDSTYMIVGYTFSFGSGQQDVYLIKIDKNGNLLWSRTYGGNNFESGNDIKRNSLGYYYITGYTYSYGAGNEDVYLLKIKSNGDTVWTRTFGGANGDETGNSVNLTSTGGCLITGSTNSFGAGNFDLYVVIDRKSVV